MYTVYVVLTAFSFVLFCILTFLFISFPALACISCITVWCSQHISCILLHALRCLLFHSFIVIFSSNVPHFPHFLALSAFFTAFSCVSVPFRSISFQLPFVSVRFSAPSCVFLRFPAFFCFYLCVPLFSCVWSRYSASYAFICFCLCFPAFSCVFMHFPTYFFCVFLQQYHSEFVLTQKRQLLLMGKVLHWIIMTRMQGDNIFYSLLFIVFSTLQAKGEENE